MYGIAKVDLRLFLLLVFGGLVNTTFASEKLTFKDQIIIEHAEIVLPPDDSKLARAYMVIWNGTGAAVSIVAISAQNGEAQLVKAEKGNDEHFEIVPSPMPRFIPPRSEFVMTKKGYFLMVPFNGPRDVTQGYLFNVELGSGRKLIAIADVLAAGTKPLDHHHGSNDN